MTVSAREAGGCWGRSGPIPHRGDSWGGGGSQSLGACFLLPLRVLRAQGELLATAPSQSFLSGLCRMAAA